MYRYVGGRLRICSCDIFTHNPWVVARVHELGSTYHLASGAAEHAVEHEVGETRPVVATCSCHAAEKCQMPLHAVTLRTVMKLKAPAAPEPRAGTAWKLRFLADLTQAWDT